MYEACGSLSSPIHTYFFFHHVPHELLEFYLFSLLFLCLYESPFRLLLIFFLSFFLFFFLLGYSCFTMLLVSTVQRSELEFPVLYSMFSLGICFIHISIYMSIPISQFIPLPLSLLGVHMFVLYVCVSISALQTGSSVPFF